MEEEEGLQRFWHNILQQRHAPIDNGAALRPSSKETGPVVLAQGEVII